MSRLAKNICICNSCRVRKTCRYFNNAIKPIFNAAEFCLYDFDDSDPLTDRLITILKSYACDFYHKEELDENS